MTSSFASSLPRSPSSAVGRRSSFRKNVPEKVPVGWRSSLYSRKKTREDSPEQKASGFLENSSKPNEKKPSDAKKPWFLRKLYVDQQTGEVRHLMTGQTVGEELETEGDTNQIRRFFPNRRMRARTQSDTTSPRASRCVWDQSLKTKSMTMNSRGPPHSSEGLPYLFHTPPGQFRMGQPRISRSAENIAAPPTLDLPTRYPRGQQRPTGLASSHHALLLRHRKIVEASKRSNETWRIQRRLPHNYSEDLRNERHDFNVRYINKAYPSTLKVPRQPFDYQSRDLYPQKRCGQEVTSLMKANRKCLEWFDTWIDD